MRLLPVEVAATWPFQNTLTASAQPITPADAPENFGLDAEGIEQDPNNEPGASGPGAFIT
jgi:hypothetical protein